MNSAVRTVFFNFILNRIFTHGSKFWNFESNEIVFAVTVQANFFDSEAFWSKQRTNIIHSDKVLLHRAKVGAQSQKLGVHLYPLFQCKTGSGYHNGAFSMCRYFLRRTDTGSRYSSGSKRTEDRTSGMCPNSSANLPIQYCLVWNDQDSAAGNGSSALPWRPDDVRRWATVIGGWRVTWDTRKLTRMSLQLSSWATTSRSGSGSQWEYRNR